MEARHHFRMGKAKRPAKRKPFKYVRVKEPAASIAERSAEKRLKKLAAWVTEAVIEKLEREGLWPPKDEEEGKMMADESGK